MEKAGKIIKIQNMKLADLIKNIEIFLNGNTKIHFATGSKDRREPLKFFYRGAFKQWQERQTKRNFNQEYIFSLIEIDKDKWLFAGIYRSIECEKIGNYYYYKTELLDDNSTNLIGRLIIEFKKNFRSSYVHLYKFIDDLHVLEVRDEKYTDNTYPDSKNIDINKILKPGDKFLDTDIEVENENPNFDSQNQNSTIGFNFISGKPKLPQNTTYNTTQQQININARHSFLQEKLYKKLISEYGEKNIGMENYVNGKKIDLVLKTGNLYTFYEIKTSNSAKQCIREALGQILEYAYFDAQKYADEIVIAGEYPIDSQTKNYLNYLNTEFNLPLKYHQIDIDF